MISIRLVEDLVLSGSGKPACECLISVGVFEAVRGLGVIDIKRDSSIADSDPGYTLHAQDSINVVTQK
jgi:hypothetical protein